MTIFNGKTHYKWPFSIAMLVYQRVRCVSLPEYFPHGFTVEIPIICAWTATCSITSGLWIVVFFCPESLSWSIMIRYEVWVRLSNKAMAKPKISWLRTSCFQWTFPQRYWYWVTGWLSPLSQGPASVFPAMGSQPTSSHLYQVGSQFVS